MVAGVAFTTLMVAVVPASATTVQLGLNYSSAFGPIAGHALKIERGPAQMGGFLTGPFAARQLGSPYAPSQYAFATPPVTGNYEPDFTFNFEVNVPGGPDPLNSEIIIKYVLFGGSNGGQLTYRYTWSGTWDGSQYNFVRAFDSVNGFAGSSHTGNWWEDPNANWGLVWVNNPDGTFAQLQASVVPGTGIAALGTAGMAGLGRRRRRGSV